MLYKKVIWNNVRTLPIQTYLLPTIRSRVLRHNDYPCIKLPALKRFTTVIFMQGPIYALRRGLHKKIDGRTVSKKKYVSLKIIFRC